MDTAQRQISPFGARSLPRTSSSYLSLLTSHLLPRPPALKSTRCWAVLVSFVLDSLGACLPGLVEPRHRDSTGKSDAIWGGWPCCAVPADFDLHAPARQPIPVSPFLSSDFGLLQGRRIAHYSFPCELSDSQRRAPNRHRFRSRL